MKTVAVLSSTVLGIPGDYTYTELTSPPEVAGLPHYVGHPATRWLLDAAGACYTPGYFPGLAVGEAYIVAQLRDPRKGGAFTVDAPNVEPGDLKWGRVMRTM